MKPLHALIGLIVLAPPAPALGSEAAPEEPSVRLWVEPLPTAVVAADGAFFLSLGLDVAVGPDLAVVVEGAGTAGFEFYGCGSQSDGGWLTLGALWATRSSPGAGAFFIHSKARARWWTTHGSAPQSGWFGCGSVDGDELGLGVGVDLGWEWTFEHFYLALYFGVNVEYCTNCPDGQLMDFDVELFDDRGAREAGFGVGFNAGVLRVGVPF